MPEVKVMRTSGTCEEIMASAPDATHLFLMARSNCEMRKDEDGKPVEYEIGDILINVADSNRFAIIAKEYTDDKLIPEALRVGIINLFSMMIAENIPIETIVMNRFQFSGRREEAAFICIVKEFIMRDFKDAASGIVNLIICNHKE